MDRCPRLHFFVGTVHKNPKSWIIVGLFYPPKPDELPLFPSGSIGP